ncbi:TonB-dependent receptor [Flavobacterium aquidurense]|uniref:TonB-dependent receptor plug domain-containing protein n=1 Tax=Flavobacterium aquidurense TaxID=362413 RepID=UPI000913CAA9|nr:TonB-dependent receptor [Flavobacterium aquidurense]OXA66517.1 TonB-dependent receptor [Flavobacterium aquidurense]SHH75814.1 outer membrane receptor for ferrienterochelin and colicins [Flavobacterium frigidimaris]
MEIKYILFAAFLFCQISFAQVKDTTAVNKLSEVVVTGQFEPQSIKKSVFNVRVISNQDIQNLAANNLSDVLNQYLNITVRPSGTSGRSTVSLFGLDAQYFKILVDNVPLVNEAGFGNNTDLSQINLNDVDHIEIVEGSMGVSYGANAVSGVLNIITKKSSQYKWGITASVQEETVNKEYSLFDQGRHIQSLKVSHTFNKNWFVSFGANRNDFQGYLSDKNGVDYAENDGTRGYRWLPKDQLNGTALIAYHKDNFRFFYKFEYLDENVDYYNSIVQSGFNTTLGSYRYGDDKRYLTNRYFHNLNVTGKLFSQLNYNVSLSHQKQARDVESFRYYLFTKSEANNVTVKDQSMEVLYSTGTLNNFFSSKTVDLQLGYEFVNNRGYALVQEASNILAPVRKTLENYDFFVSSEIMASERLSIKPGIRFSAQSQFDNQYASSLGLRYLFDKGIELRGSYGNSFRTPTFEELYSKQIFDGHFFVGNENLIPETSTSYEASLKKSTTFFSGAQLSNTFAGSYLDVNDRIDMALVRFNPDTGNPEYQYMNISKYRMWNFSTMNQFRKDNLTFNFGAALIGVSQEIKNEVFTSDDKFLYSFNLNASVSYKLPKWKTILSGYYKYNGRTQQFIEGASSYVLSTIDPSNWLDATIRQNFFKDHFEVTIGVRNILDIKNVNQTGTNPNAVHASSGDVMLAYGRSYFLKLAYNLNL